MQQSEAPMAVKTPVMISFLSFSIIDFFLLYVLYFMDA
jgi:hypothetical protein